MIIVMTCYNASKWISFAIDSLKKQTYHNWKCFIIDDCSSDNSVEVIMNNVENDNRFYVQLNSSRMGAVYNKSVMLYECMNPEDEDIIVTLDGDDELAHENVLKELNEVYDSDKVWLTYGDFEYGKDTPKYAGEINWNIPIRRQPFKYAHLRTYKWFLLKNIPYQDLQYGNGTWFRVPEDWVFMLPMLELAGKDHVVFIKKPWYRYRITPLYDMKVNRKEGDEVRLILLNMRLPYEQTEKEELKKWTCDWI